MKGGNERIGIRVYLFGILRNAKKVPKYASRMSY